MKKLIFLWSVVFVLLIGNFTAFGSQVIKIGVIGPMKFPQGIGQFNGALLAMEEINAKGGILVEKTRIPIELVKVDSNEFLSVPDATNAMELAVTRYKVDFLTGGARTEAVMAMQSIAGDNKKIFLGTGASHVKLCSRVSENYGRYKYWFRIAPANNLNQMNAETAVLEMVTQILTKELNITQPRLAFLSEQALWTEPMIELGKKKMPEMGIQIVGVWRPSPQATDLTAELSAIQKSEAHIIFTGFSSSAGIVFGKQWGELKIPAVVVGANVEAQKGLNKDGFWAATGGMGNYVLTDNLVSRVKITDITIPFFDKYIKRFNEPPPYLAATYDAIHVLAAAIEKAGTLDADKIVSELEKTDRQISQGRLVFTKDHDVTWGPGYVTLLATQWQDGENKCVWPFNWQGVTYEGTVRYKIPPWVIKQYKK